ncbi:MAG TPA: hypothetical protein VJQ09_01670, partial [Candidatus Limnocylindria bacterium]|nr:hypothetical protein [Candidatus Limnocylindria bacterium]
MGFLRILLAVALVASCGPGGTSPPGTASPAASATDAASTDAPAASTSGDLRLAVTDAAYGSLAVLTAGGAQCSAALDFAAPRF